MASHCLRSPPWSLAWPSARISALQSWSRLQPCLWSCYLPLRLSAFLQAGRGEACPTPASQGWGLWGPEEPWRCLASVPAEWLQGSCSEAMVSEALCTTSLTVTCVHGMGSGATCVQACIHSAQAPPDRHPAQFLSPISGQGVHLCRQPHGPAHPVQLHVQPAGIAHWLAVCVAPPEGGGGGVAVGAAEASPAG